MTFQYFAGAAIRALTAPKDGPSLYDVCDPILFHHRGGDAHLSKFYGMALSNPPLRAVLRRAGVISRWYWWWTTTGAFWGSWNRR